MDEEKARRFQEELANKADDDLEGLEEHSLWVEEEQSLKKLVEA